jgi:hypothetical protein
VGKLPLVSEQQTKKIENRNYIDLTGSAYLHIN